MIREIPEMRKAMERWTAQTAIQDFYRLHMRLPSYGRQGEASKREGQSPKGKAETQVAR